MLAMRTTLTLDDDNAERLRELAYRSKTPFKRVVNQVLRRGLAAERVAEEEPPYRVKASPMGLRAGLDPAKLSQFEAELDVAEFAKQSKAPRRGKARS